MTQQPRPAPDEPGAGLDVSERAGSDTLYALGSDNGLAAVGVPPSPLTLSGAIDGFLFHCRYEKNLSPKTLKAYATDLRQFTAYAGERRISYVSDVDRGVLRGFIQQMFATLAEKSVKRKVATLKALFRYLEREDTIALNPFRKMEVRIREARRVPRTIAWKDIQTLFGYLYRQKANESRSTPMDHRRLVRDIALLEILFATGARVSEVCGLTVGAVDLDGGRIRIFGKGARERTIDLCDPEVLATLREYQSLYHPPSIPEGDYFFPAREGAAVSEQTVRVSLRRHVLAAGLSVHITPHMFRHSVATLLLEEGVDIRYIQRILGHSSLVTTQIYTQVHDREQRRILSDKHPRRRLRVP